MLDDLSDQAAASVGQSPVRKLPAPCPLLDSVSLSLSHHVHRLQWSSNVGEGGVRANVQQTSKVNPQ